MGTISPYGYVFAINWAIVFMPAFACIFILGFALRSLETIGWKEKAEKLLAVQGAGQREDN